MSDSAISERFGGVVVVVRDILVVLEVVGDVSGICGRSRDLVEGDGVALWWYLWESEAVLNFCIWEGGFRESGSPNTGEVNTGHLGPKNLQI